MNIAIARTAFAAMALALTVGVSAADRKGDDNKLSRGDRGFVSDAMKGGMTEVELGKLAQSKGTSAEVKQFGQRMVDDHSKSGDELQAIAGKLGYTPPKDAGPDKGDVKKFTNIKADRFDREYMDAMVKAHDNMAKLYDKQSQKGESAELKQFAAKTLPTVRDHLGMARDLQAKMKQMKKS